MPTSMSRPATRSTNNSPPATAARPAGCATGAAAGRVRSSIMATTPSTSTASNGSTCAWPSGFPFAGPAWNWPGCCKNVSTTSPSPGPTTTTTSAVSCTSAQNWSSEHEPPGVKDDIGMGLAPEATGPGPARPVGERPGALGRGAVDRHRGQPRGPGLYRRPGATAPARPDTLRAPGADARTQPPAPGHPPDTAGPGQPGLATEG